MANIAWVNPNVQFFDNLGAVLGGGLLYTYVAGSTTNQATYTTAAGSTPNANPVVLDSAGRANVWLQSASYRFDLKTSAGVLVWSVDNVTGSAINSITQATANTVYAGPTTGPAAAPAFRALTSADLPSLSSVYALPTLANLGTTNLNAPLLAQTAIDLGSTVAPFRYVYLYGAGVFATTSLRLGGTPTGAREWTFPDSTDTVMGLAATQTATNKTFTTPTIASFVNATHSHATAAGGGLLNPLIHPVTLITANGAIAPGTPAWYEITKAGVAAMTLAAPTVTTHDGVQLEIVSNTANAHTITATGLLQTGTASVNVATFAAFAGASVILRAYQGKWQVVASNAIVFS